MKQVFVGTKIDASDHLAFRVKAAQSGLSASALLRRLALEFIKSAPSEKRGKTIRKGEAV
jgi:hypothetical protein